MKNACKYLLAGIGTIVSIYFISIYLWASAYTILSADDFSHGVALGLYRAPLPIHLLGANIFMLVRYFTWQGTYFAMYLQALLSPINGFVYPQLRIVMIANSLLLFVMLFLLLYELFQRFSKEMRFLLPIVYALSLLMVGGFAVYYEVFFWFSGTTAYGLPYSVMLLALFFALRYNRLKDEKNAFYAKTSGLLAAGGTLMVSGALCYLGLIIVGYYFLKEKKLDIQNKKIFLYWFAGALINTLAPGNYIRQYIEGGHSQGIFTTLIESIKICWRNIFGLYKTTGFVWILVVFMIIGCIIGAYQSDKTVKPWYALVLLLSPVAAFVAAFPATLGYGASYSLNNRCDFVINTTFELTSAFAFMVMGYMISVILEKKAKLCYLVVMLLLAITVYKRPYSVLDNKYVELQNQLVAGEIQNYYNVCKDFLEGIDEYAEGSDVRISRDELPKAIDNMKEFYYFDDETNPDSWMNRALRKYYKLNSFAVE